jgi:eukaryotic-like serine/threonine-protein kinase
MPAPARICVNCEIVTADDASACSVCGGPTFVDAAAGADVPDRLQRALGPGYEVREKIGAGAFGEVYAVTDFSLHRDVAVKVLRYPTKAVLSRFAREARILADLRHPSVVPVHFVGVSEGLAFMVMARVRGESLRDVLMREFRLVVDEACRITSAVASALDAAHHTGVMHRDVKPENIMLEYKDRRVQLMDFGIARRLQGQDEASTLPAITLPGTPFIIGTPEYMSPEQCTGDSAIDLRSDVYALGCVVYEMLTGKPPFTDASPTRLLARHYLEPPPPLRTLRRDLPKPLEDQVLKALAKSPGDRFPSASAFADALRASASATTQDGRWWELWKRPSSAPRA